MEKRTLGKTGLDVSVLGFGGAPIGLLKTDQQQVADLLAMLLDHGVNLIDTAAGYQGSEAAIGSAVAARRDDFVLVSKCGKSAGSAEFWTGKAITQNIDNSLAGLRTDHIDIMLLHSCDLETLEQGDALSAALAARDAGKVRHVGYSGDNETAVFATGREGVEVIETSVSICDQANLRSVIPATVEHNLGVIAKRPIANAAWKPISSQPGFYADYAAEYTRRFAAMGLSLADLGFDGDTNAVWPEIALRFTLSQPGVHTAIVGTTNPRHVQANLAAVAKGPLDADVTEKLQAAFVTAESAAGETWLGMR